MTQAMQSDATQDVFRLVLARPAAGSGEGPRLVHLWWDAPGQGERGVQVYVDGELIDASADPAERERWLVLDRGEPRRIELLAVDAAGDAEALWRPRPERLGSWAPAVASHAELAVLRDEALPPETRVRVRIDGAAAAEAALWRDDDPRGPLADGEGGSGDAAGLGLGQGALGLGALGTDGRPWTWRSDRLDPGPHAIALQPVDPAGRPLGPATALAHTADALPPPPRRVALSGSALTWQP